MALIPTTQVNVSPDDYKRKIAYALMQQGMDTSPVQAWTQGAARALQGALGGYEMYRDDQKQKADSNGELEALYNLKYGNPASQAPQASPPSAPPPDSAAPPPQLGPTASALAKPVQMVSADPAALTGPRPGGPVASSPTVVGDAEAEARGLYEPSKPGARAAQALSAPTQVAEADPMKANIDRIRQSGTDYEKRAVKALLAKQIEQDAVPKYDFKTAGDTMYRTNASKGTAEPIRDTGRSVKPMSDDERKQWKVPEGVAAGIDDNGKPVFSQPSAVNTVSPVVSGINDRFDAQMKTAQGAGQSIAGIHEARRALDSGAFTGLAANPKLWAAKVGTMFGLSNEAVANTEKLGSAIGTQVLAHAKTLGANPSNADRDYIEKVMGSKQLDEASLRGLLDMQERWARDSVKRANDAGKKLVSTDPEKLGRFAPMLSVDEPQTYDDYVKANPVQSSKPDTSALKKKYGLD